MRSKELVRWLVGRAYTEDFGREHIVRASKLDRE